VVPIVNKKTHLVFLPKFRTFFLGHPRHHA